jgi:hypothetical protein
LVEIFFSRLEFKLLRLNDWHTRAEARRVVFRNNEMWHSRKRRHSTPGDVAAIEYEAGL